MGYWKGTAASAAVAADVWTTWEITGIPQNCTLAEIVLILSEISDGATKVTVYITHDDDGVVGVVPYVTSSATQVISTRGDAGYGFVAVGLGGVWISDAGENPRVHCKLDVGSATATPRLYAVRTRDA